MCECKSFQPLPTAAKLLSTMQRPAPERHTCGWGSCPLCQVHCIGFGEAVAGPALGSGACGSMELQDFPAKCRDYSCIIAGCVALLCLALACFALLAGLWILRSFVSCSIFSTLCSCHLLINYLREKRERERDRKRKHDL